MTGHPDYYPYIVAIDYFLGESKEFAELGDIQEAKESLIRAELRLSNFKPSDVAKEERDSFIADMLNRIIETKNEIEINFISTGRGGQK